MSFGAIFEQCYVIPHFQAILSNMASKFIHIVRGFSKETLSFHAYLFNTRMKLSQVKLILLFPIVPCLSLIWKCYPSIVSHLRFPLSLFNLKLYDLLKVLCGSTKEVAQACNYCESTIGGNIKYVQWIASYMCTRHHKCFQVERFNYFLLYNLTYLL